MNLQKFFSINKIASRRETEKLIQDQQVMVNGVIVNDLAKQINPETDTVKILGQLINKVTILFYKPRAISSSKVKSEGKNIFDLLPQFKDLNAIGRLDKESEGLILISNDGVLTNIITGSDHLIEKEYIVEVREKITPTKIKALSQGMILNDGPTQPAIARMLSEHSFSLVLKEGRNHQIRRMANKLRLTVLSLKRVRIGFLSIGDLSSGDFREVKKEEIETLKQIN